MAFIEIKNLSFSYEGDDGTPVPVLQDLNLSVEKGEYVAIVGRNGSGKSTLARIITMIEEFDHLSGQVLIDGVDITDENITDDQVYEIRRKVGMVFQNPDNQLVATIVEEDVAFGPENLGVPRADLRKRVDDALRAVGMTEYAQHEPHRLSGGQKQRVAIAGVLAMKPACMILDESTAMLDPIGREEVLSVVERLNREEKITVITITHYMEEAARADRIVVLNDGEVLISGTPGEVFSQPALLARAGLETPQCTALCHRLKRDGWTLSGDLTSVDGCARAIAQAIQTKKCGNGR